MRHRLLPRLRFLAIASIVSGGLWYVAAPDGTYRPALAALGWTPAGALVMLHQEQTGGYDYRSYACGGSGVYILDPGARRPRPVMTGKAWCRTHTATGHASLSADARSVFTTPSPLSTETFVLRALDLGTGQITPWLYSVADPPADLTLSVDGKWVAMRMTCHRYLQFPLRDGVSGCPPAGDDRLQVVRVADRETRPMGEPGWKPLGWSADGRFILAHDPSKDAIVRIDVSDGTTVRVVAGQVAAFSPDGRRIAFIRTKSDRERIESAVGVIGADGRGERILFTHRRRTGWNLETRWNGTPNGLLWTPDGRALVVSRTHNRGTTLWRMDADGGGMRRIVRPIRAAEPP